MKTFADLKVKIFADGADKSTMIKLSSDHRISGFTTNPSLISKAGVSNYYQFAKEIASLVSNKPISFEVFSDDFDTMEKEAIRLASFGSNVYVKLPITNSKGISTFELAKKLSDRGVKLNITAIMTLGQVSQILPALKNSPGAIISVFAGRIADTGIDPLPTMKDALVLMEKMPHVELLWASTREVFNIIQADDIKCHIITITSDILNKLSCLGKDLMEFSLDTIKMFCEDAKKASAGGILEQLRASETLNQSRSL